MYLITFECDDVEAKDVVRSAFRRTPGVRLSDIEHVPERRVVHRKNGGPVGVGGVGVNYHEPRHRHGEVMKAVLLSIKAQPGLCTRRILQLEAMKGLSMHSIRNNLHNNRRKGLLLRKEQAGQGGWYITKKGQKWLDENATRLQDGGKKVA